MGIPAPAVDLLLDLHDRDPLRGPALTLGALDIDFVPRLRARSLAATPGGHVRPEAFFAALGILQVDAIDIAPDEGATILHDLSTPLPPALLERFGLVIDGGTLEHIADVWAALANVGSALAPGGRVVHITPVSGWENHGFYCPQPKLFFRAYGRGGFSALRGWLLHSPRTSGGRPLIEEIGGDVGEFDTDSRRERTLLLFTAVKAEGAALRPPVDSHLVDEQPSRTLRRAVEPTPAAASSLAGRLAASLVDRVARARARLKAPPAPAPLAPTAVADGPAQDDRHWEREPDFDRIFATGTGIFGNAPRDRYFTLKELLLSLGRVEADTAEVGVYLGFGSFVLRSYLPRVAAPGVRHHLFDSFAGLSDPTDADFPLPGMRPWRRGDMAAGLERVRANLSMFDDLELHAGWIPDCFAGIERPFSFVHIDVDLYEPTRASLEFFYPRLIRGGLMVFDDHGFVTCPGARRAVDEHVARAGVPLVRLTTGQAFLRKP